jgi:hypothetical protein
MADHARKQIRDYVLSLVDDLQTTKNRVFENRVYPIEELPGLIIYNGEEISEPDTIGSRGVNREFDVIIEAYGTSDDQLDEICKEVESAISADLRLGGLVKDCFLTNTSFQFSDGEIPSGSASMTYRTLYRTLITAPDNPV